MEKRLLVVDDDARLTSIVSLTATQLGFVTRQCNHSAEALDAFIEFKPHIAMIDLFMPEMDGIDVLHEFLLTGIPTQIVLTSGLGEELLPLAQEVTRFHGAEDPVFLPKPFRRAELVEVIGRL